MIAQSRFSKMTSDQKQRAKERHKKWRDKNKDKLRIWQTQWKASDPDYFTRYYADRRDLMRARAKEWADANRERKRSGDRAYANLNKDAASARAKAWRDKNKDHCKTSKRKWKQANRELLRVKNHNRRALQRKASTNLKGIKEFFIATKAKKFVICYYCEQRIESSDCHFDHIVPLARGGQHSVDNLCVSCAHCNISKNATFVQSWKKLNQIMFPI